MLVTLSSCWVSYLYRKRRYEYYSHSDYLGRDRPLCDRHWVVGLQNEWEEVKYSRLNSLFNVSI